MIEYVESRLGLGVGDAVSFALTEDEDKDEGCSGYGKYDGPHPVSPSPVWTI